MGRKTQVIYHQLLKAALWCMETPKWGRDPNRFLRPLMRYAWAQRNPCRPMGDLSNSVRDVNQPTDSHLSRIISIRALPTLTWRISVRCNWGITIMLRTSTWSSLLVRSRLLNLSLVGGEPKSRVLCQLGLIDNMLMLRKKSKFIRTRCPR